MEVDGETLNGIFSGVKRERLKEMGSFLFLLRDRISTAPARFGSDSERAIKELIRLAALVQREIDALDKIEDRQRMTE